MDESRGLDLLAFDREIAKAAARLERWRSGVVEDPEAASAEDPFDGVRSVSSRSARDALLEMKPGGAEALLRDELVRWVNALVFARIGLADDLARARGARSPDGVHEGHEDHGPRLVSWREAWSGAVAARSVGATRLWLEAAATAGPGISAIARRRAARRVEIAKRLGLAHPWEASGSIAPAGIRVVASRLLAATDALARAMRVERVPGGGLAEMLHDAVARDAGEGWPARLSPRWLHDMFGPHLRRSSIELTSLPRALGASSFARALIQFGFALRVAWAPASMPFAIAREPGFIAAHRLGFVFGALAADATFQSRMLAVAPRPAAAQARRLAQVSLFEARLQAARTLLGDDADFAPADRFEEWGVRLFGSTLDRRLCGAWPRALEDEPARLVALVQSDAATRSLRERFDDDWFRNPRAWEALREQAEMAAREPIDVERLGAQADSLGRRFEEALG